MQTRLADEFNAVDLARYVHSRRRFVGVACASALILAGVASLAMTRRYTATASLMIEPSAGMDARSATALSPVYLESLKTYENLVSSDSLFQQALDHLGIKQRFPGRSIESMKRSMLRVAKPVNTRVIDISVTLDDPKEAQQLAAYIATQAAALNRAIDERSSGDNSKEAAAALQRAEERLSAKQKASDQFVSASAGLEVELSNLAELKYVADRDRGDALADQAAGQVANRARVAELERQGAELQKRIEATGEKVERSRQKRDSLDAELKAARIDYETARAKLEDLKTSAGFRGERLEVLDPGIVPQRASSPNTPLNLTAALFLSLLASLGYLAVCFGIERSQERHYRVRGY